MLFLYPMPGTWYLVCPRVPGTWYIMLFSTRCLLPWYLVLGMIYLPVSD